MSNLSLESGTWILGADSSGVSLDAVALESINLTDGSWTLEDPDSMVSSVAFDSATKINTVTFNATAGSSNLRWNNGSTARGPRWYKALIVNGVRFTEDTFHMTYFRGTPVLRDFRAQTIITECTNPTATSNGTSDSNVQCYGLMLNADTSYSDREGGVITRNSSTGATAGATDFNTLHATFMRGNGVVGGLAGVAYDNSDQGISGEQYARNASEHNLPGSDLFWMVGFGTLSNSVSISAGDEAAFKGEYLAVGVTFP